MAHQVQWTKRRVDFFIEQAGLNEELAYIMRSRIRGASLVEQSQHLHISQSSVARRVALLKKKYDEVQKEYPDELPIRQLNNDN